MDGVPAGAELMTVSLICPLLGQLTEVTVLADAQGVVGVVACALGQPGGTCTAPCQEAMARWCAYVA